MITSRRGLFSTHRGRKVRRGVLATGSFALGLLIVSGITGGSHSVDASAVAATPTADPAAGVQAPKEAQVLPAMANPKTKEQQDKFGTGVERDAATNRSIVKIRTQGDNDYTAATQVAQKAAVAWGTFQHTMSAQEFVGSLPNVAPGADVAILNAVKGQWSSVQSRNVDSTAKLNGVTPIVQTLNEKQGVATVSVKVDQSKTGDGELGTKTVTFVVQMSRFEASRVVPDASVDQSKPVISNTAWGVIGVRQQ